MARTANTRRIQPSTSHKVEEACKNYFKCSIHWEWLGSFRTLKGQIGQEVVSLLDADSKAVKTGTYLYDWTVSSLQRISAFKRMVTDWYVYLPTGRWIEEGYRLLHKDLVQQFEEGMMKHAHDLSELAKRVQEDRSLIIERARKRRGKAFDISQYPADLSKEFGLSWGYDSLTVPEAIKDLSDGIYAAAQARRFAEVQAAMTINETQQVRTLKDLVTHLLDKMEEQEGKKTFFKQASVDAIKEFASRFSQVITWGQDELEELVEDATMAVAGLDAEDIRRNKETRQEVSKGLRCVVEKLERMFPTMKEEAA